MDTGAYSFALPVHVYETAGSYVINVTVRDNFGNVKSTLVNVAVSGSETFAISLHQGWNLVSIPVVLDDTDISHLFPANVLSNVIVVWAWDSTPAGLYILYAT